MTSSWCSSASDVSGINLPTTGCLPLGFNAAAKSGKLIDLDANTLAALGNKAPEKMEGFAVGPQLANGLYVLQVYTANINGYVPTVVPEPSTVVLMTLGLGLLGVVVVRRRRAA